MNASIPPDTHLRVSAKTLGFASDDVVDPAPPKPVVEKLEDAIRYEAMENSRRLMLHLIKRAAAPTATHREKMDILEANLKVAQLDSKRQAVTDNAGGGVVISINIPQLSASSPAKSITIEQEPEKLSEGLDMEENEFGVFTVHVDGIDD